MCTFCRTLRESWDYLKHETEASGRIHLGLAQKILDEIHHTVKEFREQQRDIRKKVHIIHTYIHTYIHTHAHTLTRPYTLPHDSEPDVISTVKLT